MLEGYRTYYRRFLRQVGKHLIGWGNEQMVGLALGFLTTVLQVLFGATPKSVPTVIIFVAPYIVIALVLVLIAVARTPVELDKERTAEVEAARAEADGVRAELVAAQDKLRAPIVGPGAQSLISKISGELAKYGDAERAILNVLIERDEVSIEDLKREVIAAGHSDREWNDALAKTREGRLVDVMRPTPLKPTNLCRIMPIYREHLLDQLRPDGEPL